MTNISSKHVAFAALFAAAFWTWPACAQETPSSDEATAEAAAPDEAAPVPPAAEVAVEEIELLRVERDPTFDRYIGRGLLRDAAGSLDPELLTDLALQFVHGEAVLFRSHKSVTADEVLEFAIQASVEKQDKESLDRLAKVIDESGRENLSARVKAVQKLAAVSRAANPGLTVSVDMSAREFALYQRLIQDVKSRKLKGDKEALISLREKLPKMTLLGDSQRQTIERLIDEATESSTGGNEVAKKLAMLASSSRSASTVEIDPRLYGTWLLGRHQFVIAKNTSALAMYVQRPVGQRPIEGILGSTNKPRIYRFKMNGRTSTIYIAVQFQANVNEMKVMRFEGGKYVDFGTWKKRVARPTATKTATTAAKKR